MPHLCEIRLSGPETDVDEASQVMEAVAAAVEAGWESPRAISDDEELEPETLEGEPNGGSILDYRVLSARSRAPVCSPSPGKLVITWWCCRKAAVVASASWSTLSHSAFKLASRRSAWTPIAFSTMGSCRSWGQCSIACSSVASASMPRTRPARRSAAMMWVLVSFAAAAGVGASCSSARVVALVSRP